ncbi:CPBP family intramembrane glutamic endopeptidase [Geminocystis sp. CENA526]|uniref:CPBP family intramembrane glutamic endopeptidase n=1 Tax=Geminocystis sp. CENA526 TaxID=1355871 RepID=UPI003D6FDFEF
MTGNNQPPVQSFTRMEILIFMGVTSLILLIISQLWRYFGSVKIIPVIFTFQAVGWGIALGFAIISASLILSQIWEKYRQSAEQYLDLIITPLVFPDLIWVGLLPGLSEELLFRGVMIPAFGYDVLALIISSLIFGVLHLSDRQNWQYALWASIIGFVFGYTAYITGNLLIPIIAHIFTNSVSSTIWKIKKMSAIQ